MSAGNEVSATAGNVAHEKPDCGTTSLPVDEEKTNESTTQEPTRAIRGAAVSQANLIKAGDGDAEPRLTMVGPVDPHGREHSVQHLHVLT